MTEKKGGILAYSENLALLQELLGKAHQLESGSVSAAVIGNSTPGNADEYASSGADVVYVINRPELKDFNPETYADALAGLIKQTNPDFILVGATKQGLELSARVAERLDIGCASWCVDFEIDPQDKLVTAKCMIYSGVGVNTYHMKTQPSLGTVSPGAFQKVESVDGQAEIVPVDVDIKPAALKVVAQKEKAALGNRLIDAPAIVDVGQGFNEKEDLALAEELAGLFGGQVSCTRPISSERDWFPEWVGLSGAKLSPELCFTIGVSGAIQHMIGIRGSKVIVAINNDENAGIFSQADYGVVADLYEFIPTLVERLRARSIKLA